MELEIRYCLSYLIRIDDTHHIQQHILAIISYFARFDVYCYRLMLHFLWLFKSSWTVLSHVSLHTESLTHTSLHWNGIGNITYTHFIIRNIEVKYMYQSIRRKKYCIIYTLTCSSQSLTKICYLSNQNPKACKHCQVCKSFPSSKYTSRPCWKTTPLFKKVQATTFSIDEKMKYFVLQKAV